MKQKIVRKKLTLSPRKFRKCYFITVLFCGMSRYDPTESIIQFPKWNNLARCGEQIIISRLSLRYCI